MLMLRNFSLLFTEKTVLNSLPYKGLLDKKYLRDFGSIATTKTPIPVSRNITIGTMSKRDLDMAFSWAEKEKWNLGWTEIESFYAADPDGYRMLWLDGIPIASLASVKYSDFAFFGLYIVIPEFRGQGYGKLLWDISMHSVKTCTSMGLNSVMNQIGTYNKEGFVLSHLNTRWNTSLFSRPTKKNRKPEFPLSRSVSLKDIVDLDIETSGITRPAFWKKALERPSSFYIASNDGNKIRGFAMISTCPEGYKLGPIYAANERIAGDLILKLWQYAKERSGNEHTSIQIDTTEGNPHAESIAKKLCFEPVFKTGRMYKGTQPSINEEKVFGLSTLEIG